MTGIMQRFRLGWNAFLGRDPTNQTANQSYGYSYRPDRVRYTRGNERSIVSAIYNRLAVDTSNIEFVHAKVDEDGNYVSTIKSDLYNCLKLEANVDQTGRAFIIDLVQSMFDEGCVAVVPIETSNDPIYSDNYKIYELKTGKITAWYKDRVAIHAYNERTGRFEDIIKPKYTVAIIENPFYSIMNEPNSILQRLIRTINKLDTYNEQSTSGKLDLIIQLPGAIRSEQRVAEANKRRQNLIDQLEGSKYGIAWTDGTEHITQLNRAVENNLWDQVKDLTTQLYNQLGLTQSIIDGSASETDMINYRNNFIGPICAAICDEFTRKFLSKNARTRGEAIVYFSDPFKLVPVTQLASIAETFRRNEIMTSNEIRVKLGQKPSKATTADELRNPNLNRSDNDPDSKENTDSSTNNSIEFNELLKSLTGKEILDG
nr:MAG TPA: portal protein [Caudoviricetes sp.]